MKYLFYTLYRILRETEINDIPAYSALLLITLFQFFNIVTLMVLLPSQLGAGSTTKNALIYVAVISCAGLLAFNYFILMRNLPSLVKKYKHESPGHKIFGIILVAAYGLISFVAILLSKAI